MSTNILITLILVNKLIDVRKYLPNGCLRIIVIYYELEYEIVYLYLKS